MITIKKPITLIFLGLQGSGKGTQAFKLSQKYPFDIIETGAIFRKMSKTGKGPAEAIRLMRQGKLVPAKITNTVMKKQIAGIQKSHSLILDGYPRSMGQFWGLQKILRDTGRDNNYLAIEFRISKKTGLNRLLSRWICSKCGMIFSSQRSKCKCGGLLKKRVDEKPELIKNRFRFVSAQLGNIKKHYKKKGKLVEINAERKIQEIHKDVVRKIGL